MARPHSKQCAGAELQPDVGALQRVGVVIVRAFASAVELIAEKVEVPTTPCAGEAHKAVGGIEVSAIGSEP